MQVLLDNIGALLVFSAVAFAVIATQFRSSQANVETTVGYMSKKQTLELASTLEQEIKLIGQGTTDKITAANKNGAGQTTSFKFWRNNGVADLEIEYRLETTDIVQLNGVDVQRYRMDRYVNGVILGSSPPTLRDFIVEPLDANGNVVAPTGAVLVRARVRDMYPLGDPDDMHLGHSIWGMTIQPEGL